MNISRKQVLTLLACLLLSLGVYHYTSEEPLSAIERLLITTYTTTSDRTTSVDQHCGGLTRSTLVDTSLATQYEFFNAQMESSFSINGYSPIYLEIQLLTTFLTVKPQKPTPMFKAVALTLPFSSLLSSSVSFSSCFWLLSSSAVAPVPLLVLRGAAERMKMSNIPSVNYTGQWLHWFWLFSSASALALQVQIDLFRIFSK